MWEASLLTENYLGSEQERNKYSKQFRHVQHSQALLFQSFIKVWKQKLLPVLKLARLKAGGVEVAMSSDSLEDECSVDIRAIVKPSP